VSVLLKRRYLCGILSERRRFPTFDVTLREIMRLTEHRAFSEVNGSVAPCDDNETACQGQ